MAYYQTDIRDSDPINDHFSGQSVWRGRGKTSTSQGFTPSIPMYFHIYETLGQEARGNMLEVCGEMLLGCAHVKLVKFPTEVVATIATEVGTSGQMPWG